MVAGYAAFQTQLKVTGSSTVTSNWDIEITNVTEGTPTGSAENAVAPSFDKLWASMEANLYDKGDAMEYDVTIENKGTLDAKLNDIITNLEKSNSDAVIITFSGYTKGEILKAGNTKIVHVKIEYNPEYEGGETSSEVEINFDYTQNNNETTPPESTYLLTYDYSTNGGTSVETPQEYFGSGNEVDLSNTATKEGWKFVGWNTDKDAQIGLKSYQMPTENTTLYAIYSKTLNVTYEQGENITSIGKTNDSCNIYNNGTSCEITLPEITVNDEKATVGWYNGEENIGKPNDKYSISSDIILRAEAEGEPYMMARDDNPNYAFWAEEYRTKIKTIDFVDNKNVPDNAIASWDVSDKQDKSVIAWIINDSDNSGYYKLYIGGTDGVIANEDCNRLFYQFSNVTNIEFNNNFNTSRVTNMWSMFERCSSLSQINVDSFDTSNVIDMRGMFYGCDSLKEIKVTKLNTSKVTAMEGMFGDCDNIELIDVSNFDTSNVTNMRDMFSYNPSLKKVIGFENFNTSKVTNMIGMFNNDKSLEKLNLCSFDTKNVVEMWMMFRKTTNLSSIYVGPNWTTEKAEANGQASAMFDGSGVSSVTQSDNCEVMATNLNLNTLTTTNSISLIASADSDVLSYSFSNDNGNTWIDTNSNVYTFENLNVNSIYNTQIRANLSNGQSKIVSKAVQTSSMEKPLFEENDNVVIIIYPRGCGNNLICTYQKNNESVINVIGDRVDIEFKERGNLVAKVSDGTNTVSSSYTLMPDTILP